MIRCKLHLKIFINNESLLKQIGQSLEIVLGRFLAASHVQIVKTFPLFLANVLGMKFVFGLTVFR